MYRMLSRIPCHQVSKLGGFYRDQSDRARTWARNCAAVTKLEVSSSPWAAICSARCENSTVMLSGRPGDTAHTGVDVYKRQKLP